MNAEFVSSVTLYWFLSCLGEKKTPSPPPTDKNVLLSGSQLTAKAEKSGD